MSQQIKVLMFSNIPIKKEKRSLGGATVLSKEILDYLKKDNNIEVDQVQIRKYWQPKFQIIDYLLWLFKFPFLVRKYDVVSIHATNDMHFYFSPLLICWLKILKKRYVYHWFGGNFHHLYISKNKLHRKIIDKTILKASHLFFETKELINFFAQRSRSKCIWLPNSRPPQKINKKQYRKKMVFISRIIPTKGIQEIVQAADALPEGYKIDIYGPIDNKYYLDDHFDAIKLNYCGILKPDEVIPTLKKYDVLLLPTYFEGEGYPGIIIEALSVGMPVITTQFSSIPEIIQDRKNGLLIPPKSSEYLLKAILSFSEDNYLQYVDGAIKSFKQFNSKLVFKHFVNSYLDEK